MARTGSSGFAAGVSLVAGILLFALALPGLPQVVRAARPGEGVPGVFVARELRCVRHMGHLACDWQGEFRSGDGRVVRRAVSLYGGEGSLAAGAEAKARDVGRRGRVYRPAGTREWVPALLLGTAGLGLAGLGVRGRLARRRRAARGYEPAIVTGSEPSPRTTQRSR